MGRLEPVEVQRHSPGTALWQAYIWQGYEQASVAAGVTPAIITCVSVPDAVMSEGEVEALKARLAGLGVQLGVAGLSSPESRGLLAPASASASTTPRVVRKSAEPAPSRGRRSRSPAVRQRKSLNETEILAVTAAKVA